MIVRQSEWTGGPADIVGHQSEIVGGVAQHYLLRRDGERVAVSAAEFAARKDGSQ